MCFRAATTAMMRRIYEIFPRVDVQILTVKPVSFKYETTKVHGSHDRWHQEQVRWSARRSIFTLIRSRFGEINGASITGTSSFPHDVFNKFGSDSLPIINKLRNPVHIFIYWPEVLTPPTRKTIKYQAVSSNPETLPGSIFEHIWKPVRCCKYKDLWSKKGSVYFHNERVRLQVHR